MGADNDSHWKTEELFMKKKRKFKDSNLANDDESEKEKSTFHYLNVPGRFLAWLEEPGHLHQFQIYLSIQSVLLAAAFSWWQAQVEYYHHQEDLH